ncbi:hypothetical protein ACP4OV_026885 [Aristida adscensionis]
MAGIVVSASNGVIVPLVDKLTNLIEDKCANLMGVSNDIVFLRDELRTINALLEKLEDIDRLDPLPKNWRDQAREMAYDIEDCIDYFVHHGGSDGERAGFINKVSHFLKTSMTRLETAKQIKELKNRLKEINERRKRCKFDDCISISSSVAIDPRLPALYRDAATLVGIQGPREEVIKLLTDTNQQLQVLSIVGFGGLGKTTLAKEVYERIGGQFNTKAFVSVFQRPDIPRLLNGLISGFNIASPIFEVKDIIDNIRLYLQSRRKWSRMKPLNDEDSRRLFFNRIFGSESRCPSQFREVSVEILKKCGGLPLAVITISSLLANRPAPRRREWESILDSIGMQGSSTNPSFEMMRHILYLSYKDLPRHLKACFLYLGIYPEDCYIKRDDLIRKWIAEGFVPRHFSVQDSEDVAKSYFNELINRSLIEPAELSLLGEH